MTDIEMLPLPEWCHGCGESLPRDMQTYARAVAEHNVRLRGGIDPLDVLIRAQEAEARAERLAEALRDALECGNDGDWQSARQYITAALRDHDQEARND